MKHIENIDWLQLFADEEASDDTGEVEESTEEEKKYSDKDVNEIIDKKFAEWQKKQDKKQSEQDEAKKLQDMNDQEKADYELQQLKDELNRLKAKDAQSEMLKTARQILADKNITASDDIVSLLVSDDAEATNKAVNDFADMYQKAVNQGVKDALKGETPKTGSKSSGLTKEEILKVTNTAERQRLINENIDLFK